MGQEVLRLDITPCLQHLQSNRGMVTSWLASMPLPAGVVLAIGNPLASLGLGLLLGAGRFPVAAATGEVEALQLLSSTKADLLLCANDLDQGQVCSLIAAARRRVNGLRVVLILSVTPVHLSGIDWQAVDVVVCRDDLVAADAPLQQAALALAKGKRYVSPGARLLLVAEPEPDDAVVPIDLTPREEEVLRGVLQGQSDRQIAESLSVTLATVRDHGQNIRRKFGVASRNELLAMALRRSMGRRSWSRL